MRQLPPPVGALEVRLGRKVDSLRGADRERAETALTEASRAVLDVVPRGTRAGWATEAPRRAVDLVLMVAARRLERDHSRPGPVLVPREREYARRLALGRIPAL